MDTPWEKDNEKLYSEMKEILREAQKDSKVAADFMVGCCYPIAKNARSDDTELVIVLKIRVASRASSSWSR